MADILVVEDEEAINELIRRNLSLVGHTCYLAMDGETAVEMIKNKSFDLIVLDIMLPKMDGFGVLEQVKGIPTILLTARSSVEDRVKGLVMGADDYLTKPFEMLELFARVEAILRRTKKDEDTFVIDNVRVEFHSRRLLLEEKVVEWNLMFKVLKVLVETWTKENSPVF